MKSFVDNDIIHKLAALDLLGEADRIFGAGRDERIVLPTARFKFLLHQRAKAEQRYGLSVVPRIETFLGSATELASAMNEDDQAILNKVVGIDQGEALFFSAASRDPDSVLFTGDKRSLRALASAPTCAEIVARLRSRVVCFEQVVVIAIRELGFGAVRDRALGALGSDRVLQSAFGSGAAATEANVTAALRAYVPSTEADGAGLLRVLVDDPPH